MTGGRKEFQKELLQIAIYSIIRKGRKAVISALQYSSG